MRSVRNRTWQLTSHTLVVAFTFFMLTMSAEAAVSFKPATTWPVGNGPNAVAVADLNGDGKPDLVSANCLSGSVSVLISNGDGTFQAARNFDAGNCASTFGVFTGDFNGDGKSDVAVLIPSDGISAVDVRILMGNGDGSLQPLIVTTLSPQETIVTFADVNGDRKADLLVNFSDVNGPAGVEVLLGNGDGTFQAPKTVATGQQQILLAVADFDHDGKADLAIGVASSVQIMLGQGDGKFTMAGSSSTANGYNVNRAWAVDVNGDSTPDLIVTSLGPLVRCGLFGYCPSTEESVFLSVGKGALGAEQVINVSSPVAVGDFDGDGKLDIAGRSGSYPFPTKFLIYPGNGDGTFASPITLPNPGNVAVAADLNGDQLTDFVLLNPSANDVAVVLNSTPDFSMIASAKTLTLSPGSEATDSISVTPVNGFSSAIQLSCRVIGPAPAPTCSLSPADIPAGANSSTTMTITAPASQTGLALPSVPRPGQRFYALGMVLGFLGFVGGAKRVAATSRRWLFGILLAAVVLAEIGCGGGSSGGSQLQSLQQYSVQVTATSDTLSRTLQVSLTAP
jgi:hypothetical protein